jgi:hypothetical protein
LVVDGRAENACPGVTSGRQWPIRRFVAGFSLSDDLLIERVFGHSSTKERSLLVVYHPRDQ